MAKKTEKKSMFGAGLIAGAGIIASIAGGYLLYGPEGKNNRKQVKSWMIKARGDMLSEIEKMKDVSKDKYEEAVVKITSKYAKLKDVGEQDIDMLKKDLMKYWKHIQADAKILASKKK